MRRLTSSRQNDRKLLSSRVEDSLGRKQLAAKRVSGLENCEQTCDDIGEACAGFSYALNEMKCTLVARGYSLRKSEESDFYRKKRVPAFVENQNVFLPMSDLVDSIYAAINGTIDDIKNVCNADHRCAGFYTCSAAISREDLVDAFSATSDGVVRSDEDAEVGRHRGNRIRTGFTSKRSWHDMRRHF